MAAQRGEDYSGQDPVPGTSASMPHSCSRSGLSSAELFEVMEDLDYHRQVDDISLEVPSPLHSFEARLPGDSSSPLLYDVTMTTSGQHVIVTDCWNRCVKAFDVTMEECPCVSTFHLKDQCPLCITKLSGPQRVVITIHQRAELYVLNIKETDGPQRKGASRDPDPPEILSFHSLIDTSHKYRGISTLSGEVCGTERLVLTLPKEIHVLSVDGQLLQVIAPTLCGLPLLEDAIYVTTTAGQDLVVADVGARRVLSLKLSGRLRWFHPSLQEAEQEDEDGGGEYSGVFRGIQWPLGVAADQEGRVLVCDLQLHSVVLLSPGGSVARLLLTHSQSLQYPRGLCLSNGRLCLTQADSIKIFSMPLHDHLVPL